MVNKILNGKNVLAKFFSRELHREFPLSIKSIDGLKMGVATGSFIFILLLLFQPFGLDTLRNNKLWIIGGYGFITFGVIWLLLLMRKLIFSISKWTVIKQIAFYILVINMIAIVNFYYTKWYNPFISITAGNFIFYTFSVGIIPATIITLIQQNISYKNRLIAIKTELGPKNDGQFNDVVLKVANLELAESKIVFIESSGNYLIIHYLEDDSIKQYRMRGTIKQIITQLDVKKFKRSHRAFIINVQHIKGSAGNALGMKVSLTDFEVEVPVARNFVKMFRPHS